MNQVKFFVKPQLTLENIIILILKNQFLYKQQVILLLASFLALPATSQRTPHRFQCRTCPLEMVPLGMSGNPYSFFLLCSNQFLTCICEAHITSLLTSVTVVFLLFPVEKPIFSQISLYSGFQNESDLKGLLRWYLNQHRFICLFALSAREIETHEHFH